MRINNNNHTVLHGRAWMWKWAGQLGSGRLIDFAVTSGRPAGPWHAWRLMSAIYMQILGEIMKGLAP